MRADDVKLSCPRAPWAVPTRAILLTVAALAPTLGWAQQSLEEQALEQQGLTRAQADWGVSLGAGLAEAPRYPGSSHGRTRLVPLVSLNYGGRLFVGPLGVGVVAIRCRGFRAGPVLGFQRGRSAGDDPHLIGLGEISSGATAGLFAGYVRGPLEAAVTARQAISHSSNGLSGLMQLNVRHVFAAAHTFVAAGPDVEFGDGNFQRTWFGISPTQSSASGLPVFTPGAGVNRIGVHAGLTYRASEHVLWRVFGRISDLAGDAAQSPVVERRTQVVVGAGIAYHF